ncbi:hypothetical protein [Specibacter cremeus]|uniref:hypothetical protein n=1 Tax=Specibacter cremeus TaxID=1629051 RepID=UPI000F7A6CC0|nr:hypothetical protein [Specibacter cremeus]
MADTTPDAEASPLAKALSVVSAFGPPVAVATALLVYFGWARSDAQARAMGLDVSLFGYTVQDYVLRSIRSLFLPLVLLVILAIGWLAADGWLTAHDAGGRRPLVRRTALAATYAGIVAAGVGLLITIILPGRGVLFLPYVMAGGVLVAAWGVRLRRRSVPARVTGPDAGASPATRARFRALEATLVFSLVTLLLFWGTADFAQAVGRGLAAQIEQGVSTMPRASVYSGTRLGIGAPNVAEQLLPGGTAPLYKYRGLRLLVVSGGKFFFLHDGWTLRSGTVVVLPDNAAIRVELGN